MLRPPPAFLRRKTTPPSLLASSISRISVSLRASLCKFRSNSLLIRVAWSQIHGLEWRSVFVKYKIQSTSLLTTFRCLSEAIKTISSGFISFLNLCYELNLVDFIIFGISKQIKNTMLVYPSWRKVRNFDSYGSLSRAGVSWSLNRKNVTNLINLTSSRA